MNALLAAAAKADASLRLMLVLLLLALLARGAALLLRPRRQAWILAAQALSLGALCACAYFLACRWMEAHRIPLASPCECLLAEILAFGVLALGAERRLGAPEAGFLAQILLLACGLLALVQFDVEIPAPAPVLADAWTALRGAASVGAKAFLAWAACLSAVLLRFPSKDSGDLQVRFWVRAAFALLLAALAAGTAIPGAPLRAGLPWSASNAALFAGALACVSVLRLRSLPEGAGRLFFLAVIAAWLLSLAVPVGLPVT